MNSNERPTTAEPRQILRCNGDFGLALDAPTIGEICQLISENSAEKEF